MDDIDRAQAREELDRALALRAVRSVFPPMPVPAMRDCDACGAAIDPRRLQAWPAATRCTECQVLHERLERGR